MFQPVRIPPAPPFFGILISSLDSGITLGNAVDIPWFSCSKRAHLFEPRESTMTMMKTFVTDVFEDKGRFVQWLIKPALGLVLLAVSAGCQTQPLFFRAHQSNHKCHRNNHLARR
jgi:hypothetical protein